MTQSADDAALVKKADAAFATSVEAQFLAALLERLRESPRSWWSGADMRDLWPTKERFRWWSQRPDLRAQVTHALTGLAMGAARGGDPDFQAELIERVLESGDVTFDAWESSFEPRDLALHGPRATIWQTFRKRFPWDDADAGDRALLVWLLEQLLEEGDSGAILTPLYVRSAIDVRIWQESIPLEIRVQVDGWRLRKELEGAPFTCADELRIVKLERMVEHVPLEHLRGIFDALERALQGLSEDAPEPSFSGDDDDADPPSASNRPADDADDKESTESNARRTRSRGRAQA